MDPDKPDTPSLGARHWIVFSTGSTVRAVSLISPWDVPSLDVLDRWVQVCLQEGILVAVSVATAGQGLVLLKSPGATRREELVGLLAEYDREIAIGERAGERGIVSHALGVYAADSTWFAQSGHRALPFPPAIDEGMIKPPVFDNRPRPSVYLENNARLLSVSSSDAGLRLRVRLAQPNDDRPPQEVELLLDDDGVELLTPLEERPYVRSSEIVFGDGPEAGHREGTNSVPPAP